MYRIFTAYLSILLGFFFLTCNQVICNESNFKTSYKLQALNNDGNPVLYGSVLNSKEDEINILLPKPLASKLRKAGPNEFSFTLVSALDSSKTYIVPNQLVTIGRKIVNKKGGMYVVVNLFNVFSQSGISVSASSLPKDNYKLKIEGVPIFGTKLNEITESFKYEPPSLIIGTLNSGSAGIITVEDLNGNTISEKAITANPNSAFFTEVRANKTKPKVKSRKNFRSQVISTEISGPAGFSDIATQWFDLTSNRNNAALYNFSLPSNGKSGWVGSNTQSAPSALRFDGEDDYLELSHYIGDLNAFTVEMWLKRNGNGIEYPRLFANTTDSSLTLAETSDIKTAISDGGLLVRLNGNPIKIAPPGTLDGSWQHIVFLWDGTNVRIFVNGTELGDPKPFTGPLNPAVNGDLPIIGGESVVHASNQKKSAFNGDIARVDVYNYALNNQQIKNNYISSVNLFPNNLDKTPVCASVNHERSESEKGNVLSLDARNLDNSGYINEQALKTGIIHAIAEKDLLSITSLDNSSETNTKKVENPLEVSEGSTLATNLVKENTDFAVEVANSQLKEISSTKLFQTDLNANFNDIGCNINQFATRCNSNDPKLSSDIKALLLNDECKLPFTIKKIISEISSDCSLLSQGYCEHVNRKVDTEKPCAIYSKMFQDYTKGTTEQLPCPPESCTEFKNITEAVCTKPIVSCDENNTGDPNQSCFKKPVKDLQCTKIGKDITKSECSDDNFNESNKRGWTVIQNSKGSEYCIATKTPAFLPTTGSNSLQSPAEIAEGCELNSCHKQCDEENKKNLPAQTIPNGNINIPTLSTPSLPVAPVNNTGSPIFTASKCEVCNCHYKCDVGAGRFFDCNNIDFFSVKCCNNKATGLLAQTIPLPQFSANGFSNSKGSRGPIVPDIRDCYCEDQNNFNEKGYIKEEVKSICKDKCPLGYEKDSLSNICLPMCDREKGQVRTPSGQCKKQCPGGLIEDNSGNCRCPEGKIIQDNGKCENITCPNYCKDIPAVKRILNARAYRAQITSFGSFTPTTFATPSPTGIGLPTTFATPPISTTSSIPPECQYCFEVGGIKEPGTKTCLQGQIKNPGTDECITITCPLNQYLDNNGICRCNIDGSVATKSGGCISTIATPPPIPNPSSTPSLFPTPNPSSTPRLFPTPNPSSTPSLLPVPSL